MVRKGAAEARNQLPKLLEAAEKGQATLVTRHGRPVAVLLPMEAYNPATPQLPLTGLEGSGRGLWGKDVARTCRQLRGEW
jgi:prevent-host-death family protein